MRRSIVLTGGGIVVVALTGVLGQHDPNYIALLWPLIGMAAGGVYVTRHPEVLPLPLRGFLAERAQRALADQMPQVTQATQMLTPSFTPPEPLTPSVDFATLHATPQPDLLAALLNAAPVLPVASVSPPRDLALPVLLFAPDKALRWCVQYFPDLTPAQLVPVAQRSVSSLATSALALLVTDGLHIRRATLGSAAHAPDELWSVLLLIADRAPSATASNRLRTRLAALHVQPYTSGGTAILLVLAAPLPTGDPAPVREPVITPEPMYVRAETDVCAEAKPESAPVAMRADERDANEGGERDDVLILPASPPPIPIDRSEESGLALPTLSAAPAARVTRPLFTAAPVSATNFGDLERAVAAATAPRAPGLPGRAALVAPSPDSLAAFAQAAPVWQREDAMPHVHLGVTEDGRIITSPLEHTNIIAPTRRGKTSVKLHMLRQLFRVRHPVTQDGVLNLFISTKYTPINQYQVDIRPIIERCFNLQTLKPSQDGELIGSTGQGIEEDGSGAYRVLKLTAVELARRLKLTREQPGTRFTPFALFADEWRVIRSRTQQLSLPEDATGKRPNAWEQCLNIVDILLPQGLEPLMPLILGSQDAHVRNNGIDTGTWANFGTYILDTDTDSVTIQNITKGDRAKIQRVAEIQKRHTGWIYLRGREIVPIWLPWVTNDLIASWMTGLAATATDPVLPAPDRDDDDDTADAAPLALTRPPQPSDWPPSVQSLVAGLDTRLLPLLKAFGALGWVPPLRVSGVERRAILGMPKADDAPNAAPYDGNLVRLLAQLRRAGMSSNALAAVLFGRTGQAAQDITDATSNTVR